MTDSAGILVHREAGDGLQVLIAHPGGPYWARKHQGAWSIVKGEIGPGESPEQAAIREFEEETGLPVPVGELLPLGTVRQRAGKTVHGFAVAGDLDPAAVAANTIDIEWPPRSGRMLTIPEIDRVEWVAPEEAAVRLNPAQVPFVERLLAALRSVDHGE